MTMVLNWSFMDADNVNKKHQNCSKVGRPKLESFVAKNEVKLVISDALKSD